MAINLGKTKITKRALIHPQRGKTTIKFKEEVNRQNNKLIKNKNIQSA